MAKLYCSAQHSPIPFSEQPQSSKNSSEMQSNKLCWRLFYDPDPKSIELMEMYCTWGCMAYIYAVLYSFALSSRAAV